MKNVLKTKLTNVKCREIVFLLAVFLLVVIPKGGFKIAGIPITWGYLYLGFLSVLSLFIIGFKSEFKVPNKAFIAYVATLPFVAYFTLHLLINGYQGSLGNLISFYVSFAFLPLLFYIFLSSFLKKINTAYMANIISQAVFIVALYGIFLFVYKQVVGHFLEIPYLTVNAGDLGELDSSKFNQRGSVSKLISTYNNGNIFGVCTLMLFPIFYEYTKSKIKIIIVVLALLLTLSRTVWIGLIFYFLFLYRNQVLKLLKVYLLGGLLLLFLGSIIMTSYFQYGSLEGFILDSNLGGRILQIRKSNEITFFGSTVYNAIEEIVYLSIFKQFGLVGLALFCLSFFTPIYLFLKTKNNNFIYFMGVITYLFVCLSDGCILLIPTLAFFYFICVMTFIRDNSSQQQDIA